MFKFKWLVVLVLLVTAVQPSFADDRAPIQVHGNWFPTMLRFKSQAKKTTPWARTRRVT